MKKQIALAVCFLTSLFMLLQYFSPHPTPAFWYERLLNWSIIIGVFAYALGIVSLWRAHWPKVRNAKPGWGYSAVTLVSLVVTAAVGLIWGKEPGTPFIWMYNNILNPISSTMFALLAFFIASAGYRAFRVRSVLATILLASAVVVMLGRVPIGELVSAGLFGRIADWLLNYPNLAAKRAILVGVGFGGAAVGLKIMLGIERSYLGGEDR